MKRLLTVAALVVAVSVARGGTVTLHVAPDGDDGWSGELVQANEGRTDGPLASLGGARDAVRRLKAGGKAAGPIRVVFADGTYSLAEPVVFTPADSGTADAPITYQAGKGARP
ncbi:right-handed parallel beta-helix repeat-containing protein, partial [bacterium]|nr:right-handed parallel beta-helix repeat-containing protein [bacterium]